MGAKVVGAHALVVVSRGGSAASMRIGNISVA